MGVVCQNRFERVFALLNFDTHKHNIRYKHAGGGKFLFALHWLSNTLKAWQKKYVNLYCFLVLLIQIEVCNSCGL